MQVPPNLAPPQTEFYENPAHAQLWREVLRLRITDTFVDRTPEFSRVLSDIAWRLEPMLCNECETPVENVAKHDGTHLKCPECGWEPITVTERCLTD